MGERRGQKRPFLEEDDDHSPQQKKPRFPKGKKSNMEGCSVFADGDRENSNGGVRLVPDLAAKERAKRRNERREEVVLGSEAVLSVAEVQYEDNTNFEIDGIEIEPFNLKQEREEGYFDENGNFVEYEYKKEIKDAWLDSVTVDARFAEKFQQRQVADEEYLDLSSEDMKNIKKRIATILQPGETIIQALKRLKGTSNDRRAKMSESTKIMFDQLTEDAMKLMENGEYNVYNQEREIFEHETASKAGDTLDMFGDDNDNEDGEATMPSRESNVGSSSTSDQATRSTSDRLAAARIFYSADFVTGGLESDAVTDGSESEYVYDPSSGYYYSSTLGYYYDPASQLYCCATTGKWYSFDEQSATYLEVKNEPVKEI